MIDNRMHDRAMKLSRKYSVTFEDAIEVLSFFSYFNPQFYYQYADMLMITARQWNVPPIMLINHGLNQAFRIPRKQ